MSDKKIISELLDTLKTFESQPFLFVGAGVSRRYLGLEDWESLLRSFAMKALKEDYAFEQYKNECDEGLPENELYPQLASLIEKDFNRVWYRDAEYAKSREKYGSYIEKGISPFKVEIASHALKAKTKADTKELQDELSLLGQLQQRSISGVITTNYDTLLEQVFKFEKYTGQEELLFSPSQGVAEIYKIHGCCENPDSIVITSKDYESFNERNAYLAAKLLTIFLEHPIIFLGYSISDPNIQSILKSIVTCLSQQKLAELKDRLIFVEWNNSDEADKVESYTIQFDDSKSLNMTRVLLKDFGKLYYTLLQNKGKYNPRVLRKLKQDVYDLIVSEEPKGCIHVANIEDDTQLDQVEVVIGVGVTKEFSEKGLLAPTAVDLYRDIIFDDGEFKGNIPVLVEQLLPKLMKQHSNSLPLWKYVSQYEKDIPISLGCHLKYSFDEYLTGQSIEKRDNNPVSETSIPELMETYSLEECLKNITYLQVDQINKEHLGEFLKDFLNLNSNYLNPEFVSGKKSDLKRLIKIYDWMLYGEKKGGA